MHAFIRTFLFSLVMAQTGCATGPQYDPIKPQDSSAKVVSVITKWLPRSTPIQTAGFGSVKDGVEIQYLEMRGDDQQTLTADQVINIQNTSLPGPQVIAHSLELNYAHIAYSATGQLENYPCEVDGLFGIAQLKYQLHSHTLTALPAITLQSEETAYAFTLGAAARWYATDIFAVEGRFIVSTPNPLAFLFRNFGEGEQTDMLETELALVYQPKKFFLLRGGYAVMFFMPEEGAGSELDFRLEGPFLGVGLLFE